MGYTKKVLIVVALTVAILSIEGSSALNILCGMDGAGLMACKPSVTKPGPVEPPSLDCCKALSGADLNCLCGYKKSPVLPQYGIDPDLAMSLIPKCSLTAPANC